MDPLSIIASITGIATAGTALSKAIYEFVSSTRGASREMLDIARTIGDLSIILGELRRVLRDGSELCNRKYLRRIKSAMRRISRIHDEIHELMNEARGFAAFKWRLKRSEVQQKLARIESHKTGINLMLNILVLAITTRKQSRLSDTRSYEGGKQGQKYQDQDQEQDIFLLRQQSENLAYAAHQSVVNLSESHSQQYDSDWEQPSNTCSDQNNETGTQLQVWMSRQESDGTANWLLDLIFSPYVQARMDSSAQSSTNSGAESAASDSDNDAQEQPLENHKGSASHSIVVSGPSEMGMAIYEPGAAASVVKELLADWTVLTEKEIESTTGDGQCPEQKEADTSERSQNKDAFIFLKDAVGRKFKLPFYQVEKFEGMKRLINAVFANVDVLGPHVHEGCFDLIDSDGYILVPEIWDDLIQPGMNITMTMWPMDKIPPPGIPRPRPLRPTQPANLEESSQLRQPGNAFDGFMSGKMPRSAKKVHKDYNQPPQVATRTRPSDELEGEQVQRSK
ncbi:hypothetical protein B0J15DRAFT_473864 [Fusarium solani]|uniref:Ubiquitin-like domain-containing protein n=1 Tax=Fusarium solani TaxID=169388 RepID=A0A9P9L661_FUSSL|nr:uncharacterized protein B0J15DRAFT_473864 [Fusarium solani]KAH7274948.1 hypothetical protein B0J15DRAFT_473864 [Fusarium solani]